MKPPIPTIRQLMDEPMFRAYMKQVPPAHPANNHGEPWQLWLHRSDGAWLTRTYASYRDVWTPFLKYFRNPDAARDVTITNRRLFYAPPGEWYRVKVRCNVTLKTPKGYRIETRWRQTWFWDGTDLRWCGRCRRPSYWAPLHSGHHAVRQFPAMTTEDNVRCYICGIRWIAMPSIHKMVR